MLAWTFNTNIMSTIFGESGWFRCSKVRISDATLECQLASAPGYDLVKAYSDAPHIAFMNCRTRQDFQAFVQRWGPLELSGRELARGKAVVSLECYETYRRYLYSIKNMIDACRGCGDQRGSLTEFFAAQTSMVSAGLIDDDLRALTNRHLISPFTDRETGDPVEYARSADIAQIREVLARCVEDTVRSPNGWGLQVEIRPKGFEIMPSFELGSLWEALNWMLFYDEWSPRAPLRCGECSKIFVPRSGHNQKYCSPECAHRAVNRKWRRKDLKARKKGRKKAKEGANGATKEG